MKKFSLLFLLVVTPLLIHARILTVNNNTNSIGEYTSLSDAISASFVNDTIYIHASPTSYGNITVNKKLHLIGEGYKTSDDEKAKYTRLGNISLDSVPGGAIVSGSVIEGLYVGTITSESNVNDALNNVTVKNCYTGNINIYAGKNWELINSNSYVVSTSSNNITIENSVIRNYLSGSKGGLISNCVFLGYIDNCSFLQVQNSIFMNSNYFLRFSSDVAVVNSSIIMDEITANVESTSGNTTTDCIFGNDPRFIDNIDYQLNPEGELEGSVNPLVNGGTDSTDIGITGGNYPLQYLDGRINLPQVYQVAVKTGVIAPGDDLIINVIGRSRK